MDEQDLQRLQARAVAATGSPVTIVDPRQPDQPLVWVNKAFCEITGYRPAEVLGRNCRFLQGPDTDQESIDVIRRAVAGARSATVTLLNYRRDGAAFWNRLRIDPVLDDAGEVVAFVGVQSDVSAQVTAEQSLGDAVGAEVLARREAQAARDRITLVTAITARLTPTLDLRTILDELAAAVVPRLADWVALTLADEATGPALELALRSAEGVTPALRLLARRIADDLTEMSGSARILAGADPFLVTDFEEWRAGVRSSETAEAVARLGLSSAMYVPLQGRDGVVGAMAFVAATPERRYDRVDLDLATELGRRVGLIVENARLYRREHRAAESLQRSLLPRLPALKDLDVAARYLPADRRAAVGGDFYEVLPLPDGTTAVAVGDVVGHDLSAAAAMGQLRSVLRTVAWTAAEDGRCGPADVLTRVDRLLEHLDVGPLATAFFGVLRPPAEQGDAWILDYASAGHPPALLRLPDGEVRTLDASPGLLLGTGVDADRHVAAIRLPVGSVLLAFTDGLIERRGQDLSAGYARVTALLTDTDDLDALLGGLSELANDDRTDDTAILALRIGLR